MSRRNTLACAALIFLAAPLLVVHAAPAGTGVLSRIRESHTLTFGYRADARPFAYTDAAGKPAGYSIALCQQVADEAKRQLGLPTLSVKWVPVTADGRFQALKNGEIDLLCGADTTTLSRRTEVDFSIPIYPGGIGAMLRTDSSPRLRDVLSGKGQPFHPVWRAAATQLLQARDFSVVAGTTAEPWLRERMKALDVLAKVAPVTGYDTGIQRVLDRQSDVFFGERAILLDAARRQPARSLVVLDRLFTYEPVAFALPRGDDDFRLLIDRALATFYRAGQMGSLYATFFGEPDDAALTFFRWNAIPD